MQKVSLNRLTVLYFYARKSLRKYQEIWGKIRKYQEIFIIEKGNLDFRNGSTGSQYITPENHSKYFGQ